MIFRDEFVRSASTKVFGPSIATIMERAHVTAAVTAWLEYSAGAVLAGGKSDAVEDYRFELIHRASRELMESIHFWRGFVDVSGFIRIRAAKFMFDLGGDPVVLREFVEFVIKSIDGFDAGNKDELLSAPEARSRKQRVIFTGKPAAQVVNLLYGGCQGFGVPCSPRSLRFCMDNRVI